MSTEVQVVGELPESELAELLADADRHKTGIVRRLIDEWRGGANRFDRPGEALFVARGAGQIVGVCGLNIDPFARDGQVGRVRRLYVASDRRRAGVGRALVAAVVARARGRFDRLHLRTHSPEADAFYLALGFTRRDGDPHCTHAYEL